MKHRRSIQEIFLRKTAPETAFIIDKRSEGNNLSLFRAPIHFFESFPSNAPQMVRNVKVHGSYLKVSDESRRTFEFRLSVDTVKATNAWIRNDKFRPRQRENQKQNTMYTVSQ